MDCDKCWMNHNCLVWYAGYQELSKIDNRTLIDNLTVDQTFKTEKPLEEN